LNPKRLLGDPETNDIFTQPEIAAACNTIEAALSPTFPKCEQILNLPSPCPQLRAGIVFAACWAIIADGEARSKRLSNYRRDLKTVHQTAAAAVTTAERLSGSLGEVAPGYRAIMLDHFTRQGCLDLAETVTSLRKMSAIAEAHLEGISAMRDAGPRRRLGFEFLVKGLADTFADVTGRRAAVSKNPYRERYEGNFLVLVETIVRVLSDIAEASNRALPHPKTNGALGKAIERILRPIDKTPTEV